MNITLYLLIWLIVPFTLAYFDFKGKKPVYIQSFLIRAILAFFHWCIIIKEPQQWPLLVVIILYQMFSFYNFFDLFLNMFRGKWNDLLYYDHLEKDSGWIDRFFAKMYYHRNDHKAHTWFKAFTFAGMIAAAIFVYILT